MFVKPKSNLSLFPIVDAAISLSSHVYKYKVSSNSYILRNCKPRFSNGSSINRPPSILLTPLDDKRKPISAIQHKACNNRTRKSICRIVDLKFCSIKSCRAPKKIPTHKYPISSSTSGYNLPGH